MNLPKKREEILKANKGSYLSYDSQKGEFVITFTGDDGFRIPHDCDYCGDHIFKQNSNTVICKVIRK